jgi:glycosyltransferase involved in cell wall biosynthesis
MKVAIVNCFDTFLDRENTLIRYFQGHGDQVTAFLSDFRHVEKAYRTQPPEGCTCVHAPSYAKNLSLRRMWSHHQYAEAIRKRLEGERWDLIWAILPPNSVAQQCAAYRRNHPEVKLVFDINDLWPESFPLGGVKDLPPFHWWASLRDHALPSADAIVTECDLFAQRLHLAGKPNVSTLYYCKPMEPESTASELHLPKDQISLCYLGSVNHIIDIDAIAAIIRTLSAHQPVTLHIVGTGERLENLQSAATAAGAQVIYHGSVYDSAEKQAIFDQCHFGLNAMRSTVCVGLTMKSIDYLCGGLPLINTIPGDTWDLIEQCGFGLNWQPDDPLDLSQFDGAAARNAARAFYEQHLTEPQFFSGVDQVLQKL